MRTVCIKIGGSTVDAEGLLRELGQSIHKLFPASFPIIVHGGGKDIARHLELLNKEFTFIEGMRVTDSEMVKIVQMVLSGDAVSYTHLRAHETDSYLVCRLLL